IISSSSSLSESHYSCSNSRTLKGMLRKGLLRCTEPCLSTRQVFVMKALSVPGSLSLSLRGGLRHNWSRLKVDIQGPLNGKCLALREPCFWDINECIEASLEKRKRVLIHCLDGYSLAPTCVIQYLMVKHNMRLMAAYEFVRARYPLNIRECHQDMLVGLERSLQPGDVDMEHLKHSMSRKVAWT
uniref:protein-tyrosine-phosphatase n=2 Tax=Gopherus TaxID=38771 RepID=A0A8C4Y731_9SAUR